MRAYKVLVVKTIDPEGKIKPIYAGSQSEAADAKKKLQEENGVKRTEVAVNPVDIPTDKAGLLVWLNKL